MDSEVDAYRYLDPITTRVVKSWIKRERPGPVPWTPLNKPLPECTVAAISSAGLRLRDDQPFDQAGERKNPWWGDPSYRELPADVVAHDVRVDHLHIAAAPAEQDFNCVLPLGRLRELAESGQIGQVAPTAYSFMGYLLEPFEFLETSVPRIIDTLHSEDVDVALFFFV